MWVAMPALNEWVLNLEASKPQDAITSFIQSKNSFRLGAIPSSFTNKKPFLWRLQLNSQLGDAQGKHPFDGLLILIELCLCPAAMFEWLKSNFYISFMYRNIFLSNWMLWICELSNSQQSVKTKNAIAWNKWTVKDTEKAPCAFLIRVLTFSNNKGCQMVTEGLLFLTLASAW